MTIDGAKLTVKQAREALARSRETFPHDWHTRLTFTDGEVAALLEACWFLETEAAETRPRVKWLGGVAMPQDVLARCSKCRGSGSIGFFQQCPTCKGIGQTWQTIQREG